MSNSLNCEKMAVDMPKNLKSGLNIPVGYFIMVLFSGGLSIVLSIMQYILYYGFHVSIDYYENFFFRFIYLLFSNGISGFFYMAILFFALGVLSSCKVQKKISSDQKSCVSCHVVVGNDAKFCPDCGGCEFVISEVNHSQGISINVLFLKCSIVLLLLSCALIFLNFIFSLFDVGLYGMIFNILFGLLPAVLFFSGCLLLITSFVFPSRR